MHIRSAPDLRALSDAAASELIAVCRTRQRDGDLPCLVLTGGSGGAELLSALAAHPALESVDWSRVRFLWGDERWVPAGDEERNDRLADDTLFSAVTVDPDLVHRMPASDAGVTLDEAARAYARLVRGIDRIDVAISGVGPDGHVCSLFPGRAEVALVEADAPDAVAVRDSPKPPPERITLTLSALNRAERAWLLAAGAGKKEAVRGIREGLPLPAALVRGTIETVLWADAAALSNSD